MRGEQSTFCSFWHLTWCFLAVVTVAALGCSSEPLDKVIVEGEVTYAGKPVANGDIQFTPIEGTKGPASGAPIVDGKYVAKAKGGVPIGKHRVMIRGFRAPGGGTKEEDSKLARDVSGLEGGPREQYIPEKYNKDSELTLTVDGESSRVTKDFSLEP